MTIAVTDSGLGGLAITAEATARMKESGIFQAVDFVFFNALFSSEGGYNTLKTREEKIQKFDAALESLAENFRPDLILIACNTLSVLYGETPFALKTEIPVRGIVEAGVEMMAEGLGANPGSVILLVGTATTVEEGTHKKELAEAGFAAERIIPQACPELETYIERGCESDETEMLISGFVAEAIEKISSPPPPIIVSLNCTHYGYSLPIWEKSFPDAGIKPLAVLNPNSRMINFLFDPKYQNRFAKTDITVRIMSKIEISDEKIGSLGTWLRKISPETADALSRYELKPDLF